MIISVLNRFFYNFLLIFFTSFILSNEFSEGPYGTNYLDIAGPFSVPDLNLSIQGDVNLDEVINIQDIILLINQILGNISLEGESFNQADINDDQIVNIQDIVGLVNKILNPQDPLWDFENQWTGNDSYIFIQYDTSVANSIALWGSSTKDQLLNISPDNVHYFFISNRSQFESDIAVIKQSFDDILTTLSLEEQNHWNNHLHFINTRTDDLNNWLSTALSGKNAIGIDTFQKIKEIGYLGNPASFTGTYIHYLAHEALYYNHLQEVFQDNGEVYDEIVVFDRDHYTGGWAASISNTIDIPTEFSSLAYNKMEVELLRGCPDADMNYSDAGCDDYDRIARMYLCDLDGTNCFEIAKWITPFDRQPHSLTDITPFLATFRANGGQQKVIKFQESGWPNSLLTLKIRLHLGENPNGVQREFIPLWNNTVQFNPSYDENRPLTVFSVPSNATKVEFVSYITGHGWGSAGCFNCCEFCNTRHTFSVNGGVYEFNQEFPDASSSNHCMQPDVISQGVVPNQYGTWGYGRAGWCPGMDVDPYIADITDYVSLGDDNVIDYNACRVSGSSCLPPPTCAGDGYCPEVAMSSYIIISY